MWLIEFYTDVRGNSPVEDYSNSLMPKDKMKVVRAFQLLEEFGTLLRQPHTDYLGDGMWELRAGSNRLFYFLYTGKTFVILHGFRKKSQKTPRREVETARRRRDEYLRRHQDA